MELDDILNGQQPEGAPVAEDGVATPEPDPVEPSGPARDEQGRFAPKGEDQPAQTAEAAPPAAQEQQSPPPGLIEERRKRQEAEQRAIQLAERLQQLEQQPQQEPYIPSVYEDENGFAQGLTQQAVQLARQQLMPEVNQTVQQAKIEIAREMMAGAHPDFAQTEAAFFEMARENPVLFSEMQRAANPVRFAYDYAKKAQEVRQIGSLDVAAIKEAAIKEYLAQQGQQPAAPQQQIPTSLADHQSARLNGPGASPGGPPTLDQILGR